MNEYCHTDICTNIIKFKAEKNFHINHFKIGLMDSNMAYRVRTFTVHYGSVTPQVLPQTPDKLEGEKKRLHELSLDLHTCHAIIPTCIYIMYTRDNTY